MSIKEGVLKERERGMTARITICRNCEYQAITYNMSLCSKCGGRLEILASENKKEVEKVK